jgi:hypothetical protein
VAREAMHAKNLNDPFVLCPQSTAGENGPQDWFSNEVTNNVNQLLKWEAFSTKRLERYEWVGMQSGTDTNTVRMHTFSVVYHLIAMCS